MYFSSNIKFLRKHRGRTQDDVAFSLNMKRSTLSGYENEVSEPNIEALVAFSKYFNIAIDTLVKVDLSTISPGQLSQLERGFDVHLKGGNLRVLATTVNNDDRENIELVTEKAKAGYATGFADPEYIKVLPTFSMPFLSFRATANTAPSRSAATPCCPSPMAPTSLASTSSTGPTSVPVSLTSSSLRMMASCSRSWRTSSTTKARSPSAHSIHFTNRSTLPPPTSRRCGALCITSAPRCPTDKRTASVRNNCCKPCRNCKREWKKYNLS